MMQLSPLEVLEHFEQLGEWGRSLLTDVRDARQRLAKLKEDAAKAAETFAKQIAIAEQSLAGYTARALDRTPPTPSGTPLGNTAAVRTGVIPVAAMGIINDAAIASSKLTPGMWRAASKAHDEVIVNPLDFDKLMKSGCINDGRLTAALSPTVVRVDPNVSEGHPVFRKHPQDINDYDDAIRYAMSKPPAKTP